jgi:nucleoside phosphorylase
VVGLRPQLGENLYGQIGGFSIAAKTIGVGIGVAGVGAANRIHQWAPRAVIVIGTCGVYPGNHGCQPLDLIVADHTQLFDPAVAAGRAAFPDPMQTSIPLHPGLTAGLRAAATAERTRGGVVATTMAITTDDAVAQSVPSATGLLAENLELFPAALACRAAELPCAAVLGITNLVGSTARIDWRKFQRDAVIGAAEVIVRWLEEGAAGLPSRPTPMQS